MHSAITVHRRHFLVGAAGTTVLATASGGFNSAALAQDAAALPDYAAWKERDALIVHTKNTMETKRGFIGTSGITPNDEFFVRNNLTPPSEDEISDRDAWSVAFDGTRKPGSMTIGELKTLGLETVATVIQCSGNGRGLFDHKASGSPWKVGAAGCALWSGVPVRAVVDALGGIEDGRKFMTSTGGENLPKGIDPKTVVVERSVPLKAAMDHAILAWEMNGKPVPVAHGGPLRVVMPGYYGVNNIKYVKRVAFTEKESDANIQQTGYRVRAVGVKGAADQPSMWEMKVKSWVTRPLMDAKTGKVPVYGVAFGGINAVKKVEVSTDGGKTWHDARFVGPELGRYAWRPFVYVADLKPGTYVVTSRATDSAGRVQEEVTEPNHRGYDYSGWRRLAVSVTVA
jgi:DMSO/TMAO reductase YedYZ molybdopterin-dependent catalytic subunit